MRAIVKLLLIASIIFLLSANSKAQQEIDLSTTPPEVAEAFLYGLLFPEESKIAFSIKEFPFICYGLKGFEHYDDYLYYEQYLDYYTTNYHYFKFDKFIDQRLLIENQKKILNICFIDTLKYFYIQCLNHEYLGDEMLEHQSTFKEINFSHLKIGDTITSYYQQNENFWHVDDYLSHERGENVIDTLIWQVFCRKDAILDLSSLVEDFRNLKTIPDSLILKPYYHKIYFESNSMKFYPYSGDIDLYNISLGNKIRNRFAITFHPYGENSIGFHKILIQTHSPKSCELTKNNKEYIIIDRYCFNKQQLSLLEEKLKNGKLKKVLNEMISLGQSPTIDYETFELNLRGITNCPQPICEPVVFIPSQLNFTEKDTIDFEFAISPYLGDENAQTVTAQLFDLNHKLIDTLDAIPLDEIPETHTKKPSITGKREYYININKTLPKGSYFIEVKHKLHGKSKVEEVRFKVE